MHLLDDLQLDERLPIEWASEIEFDPTGIQEIVEEVFGARRVSVTYGASNSGKTTLMLDLAFRMTAGLPWLGKRVEPGAVIWVAAESPNSVRLRLEAYRRHHGVTVGEFAIVPVALNLLDGSGDVDELIDMIKGEQKRLRLPLRWLGVDTVARVMPTGDENSAEDMGRLVATGDRFRVELGCHVNFIHHSGKEQAKGARGHSSLRAAVDTELEVVDDPATGLHTITVTKQRDIGGKGLVLSARFKPIELGRNQWDKPVTACVVVHEMPESDHLRAVKRRVDEDSADAAVLAGFKALEAMGVRATDGPASPDYLPRHLLKKSLSAGFDRPALEAAMHRLMTRGALARDVTGQYPNRTPRYGLVAST